MTVLWDRGSIWLSGWIPKVWNWDYYSVELMEYVSYNSITLHENINFSLHYLYTKKGFMAEWKLFSWTLLRSYVLPFLIVLEIGGTHSSKECCASPPDIDVGHSDNPDFQGSAYSRSSSSFLIEDILFQRPKVNFKKWSWHQSFVVIIRKHQE